jgi:hypothetical protein
MRSVGISGLLKLRRLLVRVLVRERCYMNNNNDAYINLPLNTTWVYNKYNNSLFPVKKNNLKVGDIVVSNSQIGEGRITSLGFMRVTKVWYDDYGQMCWTSVSYNNFNKG